MSTEVTATVLQALDSDQESLINAKQRQSIQALVAFKQACLEIRRMMMGLDTIRVMGRVESGRLGKIGAGLAATIEQLDKQHGNIAARLQRQMELSAAVLATIKVK